MGADGFAQAEAPDRFAIVKLASRSHSRVTQQDAPPHLEGKYLDVASPIRKIVTEQG